MIKAILARVKQGHRTMRYPDEPIALPDWAEAGPRRISYLWHCRACDYQFEAVAFFDASHPEREALAA